MFADMFDGIENGNRPRETFYDGYVVNAVMDAAYKSTKSKKWEPIELEIWRGKDGVDKISGARDYNEQYYLIKEETTHYGATKVILKDKKDRKSTRLNYSPYCASRMQYSTVKKNNTK